MQIFYIYDGLMQHRAALALDLDPSGGFVADFEKYLELNDKDTEVQYDLKFAQILARK